MGEQLNKKRSCNDQSWRTWLSMAQQFTLEFSCKRCHPLMVMLVKAGFKAGNKP